LFNSESIFLVDHVQGTFSDALSEFRSPSYDRIEMEASVMLQGEVGRQDISGTDIKFTAKKSLLGYDKMEKVGPYNCRLVDMTGLEFSLVNLKPSKTKPKEEESVPAEIKSKLPSYDEYFAAPDLKTTDDAKAKDKPKGKKGKGKKKDKEKAKEKSDKEKDDAEAVAEVKKEVSASLWLSDEFPLPVSSLLHVLEIVSPASEHISKLKDILSVKLPPGFPVKMVVPVVTSINAAITFSKFHIIDAKAHSSSSPAPTPSPAEAVGESGPIPTFSVPTEDVLSDVLFDLPPDFRSTS